MAKKPITPFGQMLKHVMAACAGSQKEFGKQIISKDDPPLKQNTLSNALRRNRNDQDVRTYFGTKNRYGIDLEASDEDHKIIFIVDRRKVTHKAMAYLKKKGYRFIFVTTTYQPDTLGSLPEILTAKLAADTATSHELLLPEDVQPYGQDHGPATAYYKQVPVKDLQKDGFYFIVHKDKWARTGYARPGKSNLRLTNRNGDTLITIPLAEIEAAYWLTDEPS